MSIFVVFAVDSADRLTLLCPPVAGKGPEFKQVALSFLQCPKLARRSASGELGVDEPCAYDAMELTRSNCIGKQVRFTEDFFIDPLQRFSGRITLSTGADLSEMLLSAGYATVPTRPPPRMPTELHEQYVKLMNAARFAKKGTFAGDAKSKVRPLTILAPTATLATYESVLRGKTESVRVERVLTGSMLLVTILKLNQQATFIMSGAQAPTAKGEAAEASVGADAKFYTEKLLLHRNVNVRFEGVDPFQTLFGSIVSPAGVFQKELLKRGFAKLNPHTASFISVEAEKESVFEAEREAQLAKVGVWAGAEDVNGNAATTSSSSNGVVVVTAPIAAAPGAAPSAAVEYKGDQQFEGSVVQIISGDTIVVRHATSGASIRVSLAGVRCSRSVQRDHDGRSAETRVTYSEYTWEAKELLRTTLIGQRVAVSVEYARMIPETQEVRPMVTVIVLQSRKNAAALVLEAGYGTFFLGRNDVCSRAMELQASEAVAREAGRGLHSTKDAPTTKVVELSRLGEAKGKYYLSFLQRGMQGGRAPVLRGVVDVVLGGGSFRVHIPKEHFQIPFKLAGVVAPQGAVGSNEESDPFAAESKDFAIAALQQREVEIQVDTSDRAGNFIGMLKVDGANFAVQLVEAGLATVGNGDRLPYISQLHAAEQKAKANAKYIWSEGGAVPSRQARMDAQNAASASDQFFAAKEAPIRVTLADVEDAQTIYVQLQDAKSVDTRRAIRDELQQYTSGTAHTPTKSEIVCALYRADGSWNRAKVLAVYKDENRVEVQFLDFGTTQEIKLRDVRPIPKDNALLRQTPAQAVTARLAFIKKPTTEEYSDVAYDEVYHYVGEEDMELEATSVYKDGAGRTYYTLLKKGAKQTLNEALLEAGVAVVAKASKSVDAALFKKMAAAQELAHRERRRLWKFGDVGDDSDQD